MFVQKSSFLLGEIDIFRHFLKSTSMWLKMAPCWPKFGLTRPREASRWPQIDPGGSKMAPVVAPRRLKKVPRHPPETKTSEAQAPEGIQFLQKLYAPSPRHGVKMGHFLCDLNAFFKLFVPRPGSTNFCLSPSFFLCHTRSARWLLSSSRITPRWLKTDLKMAS